MKVNSKDKPNAVVIPGGCWSFSFKDGGLELNSGGETVGNDWFHTESGFGLFLVYGTSGENLTVEKLTHE